MANTAVFGLYATHDHLESAVTRLKAEGFRPTDISLLMPENPGSKELAHVKNTKAPEGGLTGAVAGAIIGGTMAWMVAAGTVTIPSLNPLVTAGGLVAALAGLGAGGVVGGLIGALIGLAFPEYEARRFEGRLRKGGILLSVHADNAEWQHKGQRLLKETGAERISATGECKGDFANGERPRVR